MPLALFVYIKVKNNDNLRRATEFVFSESPTKTLDSDKNNNKRAMMALGRSPEYHWNQIISKSVHRFSRRSRLKLFSIYSPGGHFLQQNGTI